MIQKRFVVAVLVVLTLGVLMFTRAGVFLVFDVVGDIGGEEMVIDPALAPLQPTERAAESGRHALPSAISQPSGIVYDAMNERFYVSTDQGELFELNASFEILERRMVARGPLLLRQGSVETVALMRKSAGTTTLLVAGEGAPRSAGVGRPSVKLAEWGSELEGRELAGMTYRPPGLGEDEGRLYAVENDSAEVFELTPSGRLVSRWIPIPTTTFPKDSGSTGALESDLSVYCFSGVSATETSLWIVSQNYSTLFEVDLATREILRVVELPVVGEYSDIAVVGTDAYLTVDHDLFDERPPLVQVKLPEPS